MYFQVLHFALQLFYFIIFVSFNLFFVSWLNLKLVKMKKKKFVLEYMFEKASRQSIWSRIATPEGLADWFADDVRYINDSVMAFTWKDFTAEATVVAINQNNYIRFHWLDDEDENAYFEFLLLQMELTGAVLLRITDFIELGEEEDIEVMWNAEVGALKRVLGL